jgi:hypothetical protein
VLELQDDLVCRKTHDGYNRQAEKPMQWMLKQLAEITQSELK